ncbi:MAG: hypothetical protein E7076_02495 [Bacteroidales bacterium]|nr:hypothetical protein [Bacteroidales bacterium]
MAGIIKRKIIRPVRDGLLYYFFQSVFIFSRIFPRKLLLVWHGFVAKLFFHLLRHSRKNILKHLTMAFGKEKCPQEIYAMGKEVFVYLSKTFTDYGIFSNLTTREEFSKYFKIEGEEHLKKAYEKGKGVICLIPHTAGWEFSAIMPPVMGYETSALSREIKNKALNKLIIKMREKRGMKNISRHHNCYDCLTEVLRKGECLIFMMDQDSKRIKGEFLKFFGMNAYTPVGCAKLAMDTGASIVPMATFRNEDDTYTFKIYEEVPLVLTGNKEEDIRYNTQIHNDIMENIIKEKVSQWVWMHKRWDTTPEKLNAYLKKKMSKYQAQN